MSELKLGKMTSKEMAEWFGKTKKNFSNHKPDFLKKLENFAKFKSVYGGVIIEEIYCPTYMENLDLAEIVNTVIYNNKNEDRLSSAGGIARKLMAEDERFSNLVNDEAFARRIRTVLLPLYGETNTLRQEERNKPGELGSREYVWAIKVDDFNHYRYRTAEEEAIYQKYLSEYAEGADKIESRELRKDAYKKGEITLEQYAAPDLADDDFFKAVIRPFKKDTGYILTHATKYEVDKSEAELRKMGLLES